MKMKLCGRKDLSFFLHPTHQLSKLQSNNQLSKHLGKMQLANLGIDCPNLSFICYSSSSPHTKWQEIGNKIKVRAFRRRRILKLSAIHSIFILRHVSTIELPWSIRCSGIRYSKHVLCLSKETNDRRVSDLKWLKKLTGHLSCYLGFSSLRKKCNKIAGLLVLRSMKDFKESGRWLSWYIIKEYKLRPRIWLFVFQNFLAASFEEAGHQTAPRVLQTKAALPPNHSQRHSYCQKKIH